MKKTFFTKDPSFYRSFFKLMTVIALQNLVAYSVNMLDNIMLGSYSQNALSGAATVNQIYFIVNQIALAIGNALIAISSQYWGSHQTKPIRKVTKAALLFSLAIAAGIVALCIRIPEKLIGLFTTSPDIIREGTIYLHIIQWTFLFFMISNLLLAMLRSVETVKIAFLISVISLLVNGGINYILIFGRFGAPEMGIRGAALATGLGQVFTVIVYLIAYKKCSIPVEISRKYLELNRNLDGKLYMVGIPAILNIALPSVLISFLNQILSAFSGSYVVVLGIYYKLQTFLYLPASGIVQGMRPLIGYNYGAGEIQRVKKLFGISVLLNGMIMLAGTIICFTASETLMGMFTENPETVRLGTAALQIISIGFIPSAISVTASGALEGLSKGAQSLVISLLRYIIVIIPAAYLLCHFAGADAVWNAFWICEFITAVVVGIGIKYYWNRLLQ